MLKWKCANLLQKYKIKISTTYLNIITWECEGKKYKNVSYTQ